MIEAGHLNISLGGASRMWQDGCRDQTHVRCIRQQAACQNLISVCNRPLEANPHRVPEAVLLPLGTTRRKYRAHGERPHPGWRWVQIWLLVCQSGSAEQVILELFRRRHIWHRVGVFEAILGTLKRNSGTEYGLTTLDGDDPPGREAAPIAYSVHFIKNWPRGISCAYEVGVNRVRVATLERVVGRPQRLGQHLTAKKPHVPVNFIQPAVKILLDRFQIENLQQPIGFTQAIR